MKAQELKARDIMSANPVYATPDHPIRDVAQLMIENDCGAIPVVEGDAQSRVIGMVTDRDITCRAVAKGLGPDTPVREVMSDDVSVCGPDDDLRKVEELMSMRQIRRVPVVDEAGRCVGMVSQADIARKLKSANVREVKRVVEQISRPNEHARADGNGARSAF